MTDSSLVSNMETASAARENPSVEAARQYLDAGWAVVPVEPGTKSPKIAEWPRLAADRAFSAEDFVGKNVGVVLGSVSGGLVDIDLDSAAAIALAKHFLPPTLTFGRSSKPASHWLYTATGVRSAMFFFPVQAGRELVEIRSTNASRDECGHQSVFPGSTHESGEAIVWDDGEHDEPQPIEPGVLVWAVSRLTVASAILDGWIEGSGRHEKSKGLAGGLLKLGWTADEVRECLAAVRLEAGDSPANEADFSHDVETTIAAFENGAEVTGFGSLVNDGFLAEPVAKAIERHGTTPEARLRAVKFATTGAGANARARMIAEAREVDGLAIAADLVAGLSMAEPANEAATAGAEAQTGDASPQTEATLLALGMPADLSVDPEPLHYVCEGLAIAPGKISSFSGYAGTGKGPLMSLFALCAAAGKPFLGHRVRRCNVLIADFETGKIAETRLKRIARALGVDIERLAASGALTFVHAGGKFVDEPFLTALSAEAKSKQLGLVCLDSYTSAVLAEQNEAEYAHAAFALGAISNGLDLAIVANVHHRKTQNAARGSGLEMVSGHNALAAAMQTVVSISRPDDEDACLIELRCARSPEEPFKPLCFRWEDVTNPKATPTPGGRLWGDKWGLRAVLVDEASRPSKNRNQREKEAAIARQVLRYVKAAGPGLSMRAIQKHVTGAEPTIKTVVLGLAEAGKLAAYTETRANGDQHTTYSTVA